MKTSKKRVRYAVVGLGHIAQIAVLPAFANAQNSDLAALISGDPKKQKKLSQKYGVPSFHYDDFERAVKEEQIDAVFIALPNTQHRAFTERAARARVHVLCEKPMATTEKDCLAMIAACEKADVRLMIAYRLHFAPAHLEAIALARSGNLGDLRFFSSIFGMQVNADNIRTDPKDGGGPLRDLGVYCINAARYLFSDEPVEVRATTASKRGDRRFAKVEEMASALLHFPGERVAQFTCSFGSRSILAVPLTGPLPMKTELADRALAKAPEIVRIVLCEVEKGRRAGHLTQEDFDAKISRIVKEELQPRRLDLLIRELADGRTRFIIKHADSGRVCEMVECAPPSQSRGAVWLAARS